MSDEDWRDRAECRGLPHSIFFPVVSDDGDYQPPEAYAESKAICMTCPVRRECLEDELRQGLFSQHGMRGGVEPWQRRQLIRQRNKASWR